MRYRKPVVIHPHPVQRYMPIFKIGQEVTVSNRQVKPNEMDRYKCQRWLLNNYTGVVVSSTSQEVMIRQPSGFVSSVRPFMGLSVCAAHYQAP